MFQAIPQIYTVPQSYSSPPTDNLLSLPPNTTVPLGPDGKPKPRKMRASCDACSHAKVKCDKVRPTCQRCGNMSLCCNYSPSMRLGKPRKNRNPDGSIIRDIRRSSSCGPFGSRPDIAPRLASDTVESSPEPTDSFYLRPATPNFQFQGPLTNNFDGNQSPPYSEASWSNEETMAFQTSRDMMLPMTQFAPLSPYNGIGHVRSASLQSQPDYLAPMDNGMISPPVASPLLFGLQDQQSLPIFEPETFTLSPPLMAAPQPSPASAAPVPSHDCTQFAFQILNSLYSPPSSQPTFEDFNGGADGLPTLDSVLSASKAAVESLPALLGCPCSANPHFSTTIAFSITKILSWYQAIAGVVQDIVSPINTRMEAFTHTPILLGDFKLEIEDEETFRTQIILGELRKVEKLIDMFSECYCKASSESAESGVYTSLESLLRTRVRDTFKVTMRTAPLDVKRQVASRTQSRTCVNTL
ncbi:Zn-II 2Cys6 regulatory protein [Didymella exigua CBS 183.55]|uniref:Zn-II 2Cys6 regulatory protein n=1 Tax=Didymella exigua CBS 183.55 TaxID=1150837 RepID=A0A6A5RSL9_9PLEO|nr:Zn-II 2Cys6 regulatory protein [Didymella exigua CBS 183.55]KAF1930782.1 Zn-II 2Cys6 regulatory protein [Didymella exigua CBS 183.55]